jgi:hypothetical protein
LGASRLRVDEDRLTDVVAVAAQRSLPFARALLSLAGLDRALTLRVTRLRVVTQAWTPRGRRPDMELIGYDGNALICRVWCESKLEALYQPGQLEDYSQDLVTLPGAAVALLTIVTRVEQEPVGAWKTATWADIAAAAVAVMRDRLGLQWRKRAWLPETPAELLVLAELLEYLDQEHRIVSDPLTSTDVLVYAHAARAGETLDALLERAAQLCGEPMSGGVVWSEEDTSMWMTFGARDADWWASYDGYAEMHLADSDSYFGEQRRGEPAVGLGVTLPGGYAETIFAERTEWIDRLRQLRVDPAPDDDVLRLYRAVYLAEVLIAGVTLEEQARWLAERMREVLRDLRGAAPDGALRLPPRRGARRRSDTAEPGDAADSLAPEDPC